MAKDYLPYPYQHTAYSHVMYNSFCGLFLDMGLGKTIITLTALADLILMGKIKKVLIIAPLRVANTVWKQEAAKWMHTTWLDISVVTGDMKKRTTALNKDASIYVINRENVKWLCDLYQNKLPFDTLVIDELSSFKSNEAQRFKALKRCLHCFTHRIGLTGTPIGNGYMDLWAEMFLLDGGDRLAPYITRYREKYFWQKRVGSSEYAMVYELKEGSDILINDKIGDICLSMKTEDYLQLPEFTIIDEIVTLPDNVLKSYKDFERDKIMEILTREITAESKASLSNKLLQYSNGACYYEGKEWVEVHKCKIDRLLTLIEKANGEPILIAYQYKHDLTRLLHYVKTAYPSLRVEVLDNDDVIDRWNKREVDILFAHPLSAGHGLNLQFGGNIMIWFGLTWSLEQYQQFNKRVHRQGVERPVICYRIMCEGTYDEIVRLSLDEKGSLQDLLMEYLGKFQEELCLI